VGRGLETHVIYTVIFVLTSYLTLNLLTTTIVAPPSNGSKWQMGFNSAFKGLSGFIPASYWILRSASWKMWISYFKTGHGPFCIF